MDVTEAAEPSPADQADEAGQKYLSVRQAAFIGRPATAISPGSPRG